jgi:hypothetical protein
VRVVGTEAGAVQEPGTRDRIRTFPATFAGGPLVRSCAVEHFVITQVVKYGYAAILVLMVAESACIPIPSEVMNALIAAPAPMSWRQGARANQRGLIVDGRKDDG